MLSTFFSLFASVSPQSVSASDFPFGRPILDILCLKNLAVGTQIAEIL